MKREYTKIDIVNIVKSYDTRAKTLSTEKIDDVIDQAYAELCTVVQAFSDEEIISVAPYIDAEERKFSLDIIEDVSAIYDLYVTIENQGSNFEHGIQKVRDTEVIWKDNRYKGRSHVDLSKMPNLGTSAGNVVLKYYFVPLATTESVYMDAQTLLAFKNAIGLALYDTLHDVARSEQKRSAMNRTALAIMPSEPEDALDPNRGHIFAGLEH